MTLHFLFIKRRLDDFVNKFVDRATLLETLQNSVDFEGKTCHYKDGSECNATPREDVVGELLGGSHRTAGHQHKAQDNHHETYRHKQIVTHSEGHRFIVLVLDLVEPVFHISKDVFCSTSY